MATKRHKQQARAEVSLRAPSEESSVLRVWMHDGRRQVREAARAELRRRGLL